MKFVSWNVNGLRSVLGKGLLEYIREEQADVYCFQEIKAEAHQVEVAWPEGYRAHWNSAEKKGYSGTLILTRQAPIDVTTGIGEAVGDSEGRVITAEWEDYYLVNVYTPNSQNELARLDYRVQTWDPAFREHCCRLAARKPVIFCGDLNVAHQEIDLANPSSNRRNAGFTDEERQSFSDLLDRGFIDTFRRFDPSPRQYSWWSYRAGARARNVGWRIDYFGASAVLADRLRGAWIRPAVTGSDHCPVGLELV